jgi:hypothetical protein
VGVITGGGVCNTVGVGGVRLAANLTCFARGTILFLGRRDRRNVILGCAVDGPACSPVSLAYVIAIYLSKISSSSSMTSGSSSSSISSGTVVIAFGGVLITVGICYPTNALPFSALVGAFLGGLYVVGGFSIDDWAVFALIRSNLS